MVRNASCGFVLLDLALEPRRVVRSEAPLTHTNIHDVVVCEERQDRITSPTSWGGTVEDWVIQEIAQDGREALRGHSPGP